MTHTSAAGRLLIATPAIGDGNFEQSVIFILHHDPVGALGVIINDRSALELDELLPRWSDLVTPPSQIFTGGPVEPNGFIGVGRAPAELPEGSARIAETNLVTIDLEGDPTLTAAQIDRLRVFRGYAGWAPHQLDTELAAGAWFTVDADSGDIWSAEPDDLYERVLRRQRGELRWFANAPTDPSSN